MQLTHDMIEERAAILEHDAGLPRDEAQDNAAQAHGFADWAAWMKQWRMRNK